MADKTYKNLFDDGYTTYHDDGTKSTTYKNLLDDGYTTYNSDGSKSKTYNNLFDNGTTTYHDDGSTSKTYQNVLDDGYTTYNSDGSTTKSYTTQNLFDDGYTTHSYTYGGTQNTYGGGSYGSSYGGTSYDSYIPTGFYYSGASSIDKTPYRINKDSFPGWALALLWLAFGLMMLPGVWASFHASSQTMQIMFTITCCLLATWSAIHMIQRPGFYELFACFILSFCMCMLNIMGGTWTHLLLIGAVGFVLYIYMYSNKLNVNYYGKLHDIYMWASGLMIINAGFYLFKWKLGLQIMMLVWLAAALIYAVVNIVQKIIDMVKTKQFASFSRMKPWIMFVTGVVIPLIMRAMLPKTEPWICGAIGLGAYFAVGVVFTGKNDNRKLFTYTLCFGMISFALCSLIRIQGSALSVISNAFGMLDGQIGASVTRPVVDFVFRTIDWLATISAYVSDVVTQVVLRLAAWGLSFAHRNLPDYFAIPNQVLTGALCVGPTVLCAVLGTAIGKALRKDKKK